MSWKRISRNKNGAGIYIRLHQQQALNSTASDENPAWCVIGLFLTQHSLIRRSGLLLRFAGLPAMPEVGSNKTAERNSTCTRQVINWSNTAEAGFLLFLPG